MASTSTAQTPLTYNLTGALIFTAYVLAALFLAVFIIVDLATRYRDLAQTPSSTLTTKLKFRLQLFSALSALSFSVLSYHMLNYLILSYRVWATANDVSLPRRLPSDIAGLHVWRWLTSSTLFLDFAQTICGTSARFWWTQQSLLVTLGWNVFMVFEGRKRSIPHLEAYFIIGQILPISFTINLFSLAILLYSIPQPTQKFWTPTPIIQLLPLMAYYVFVLLAPFTADGSGGFFIIIVVFIRLLLFFPLLLPMIVPEGGGKSYLTPRNAGWMDAGPWYFIGVLSVLLWLSQTFTALKDNNGHVGRVLGAVNDSPAVSALGYDYMLSLVTLGFWAFGVGNGIA